MKIAQVNTFDIMGGASRAAYRLQKGLTAVGVDCRMISNHKSSKDEHVIEAQVSNAEESLAEQFYLSTVQHYYIDTHRTGISNTIFSLPYPGIDISGLSEVKEADVLNLHWVAWYQSVVTLKKLFSLGKPIVWTLHDQWPFTGGCHYSAGCSKYRADCSRCPQLEDDPFDLAAMVLKDKLDFFKGADLTIVTPSKWLASCAKESTLFKDLRVEVIPNSLETDVFVPQPKVEAKQRIRVSPDDITILFGAEHGIEKRKGFHELVAAMQHCMSDAVFQGMAEKRTVKILCFGNASNELQHIGLPVASLGYLTSDEDLRDAYSAADLFVIPSLEDNLPNTMLESLSCATPVVAFDTGGISDIIIEGETGRLAPTGDSVALGRAILAMISDPDLCRKMGQTGRERMTEGYSLDVQAKRYLALYEELRRRAAALPPARGGFSSSEEELSVAPMLDTTLGANFKGIYDQVQAKSLKEAALAIQRQFTQCSEVQSRQNSLLIEKDSQLRQKDEYWKEQLRQVNDRLKLKEEQLQQHDEQLKQKVEQLRQKDEELRNLQEQRKNDEEKIRLLGEQVKEKDEQFRQKCEELIELDIKFKVKCVEVVSKDKELMQACEELSGERQKFEEELRLKTEDLGNAEGTLRARSAELAAKGQELTALREETAAERQRLEEKLRLKADELREALDALHTRTAELSEREQELVTLREKMTAEKLRLEGENKQKDAYIADLLNSMSWKITSPLRAVYGKFKKDKTS